MCRSLEHNKSFMKSCLTYMHLCYKIFQKSQKPITYVGNLPLMMLMPTLTRCLRVMTNWSLLNINVCNRDAVVTKYA
jgi:hypothetical protein